MMYSTLDGTRAVPAGRALAAVRAVLPASAEMVVLAERDRIGEARLAGRRLRVGWAGEGWTADIRPFLDGHSGVDVVAARRLSPGARDGLDRVGIGWVDELGNAEISLGTLVISRTGRPESAPTRPHRWTPGVVSVAEALLCGIDAKVSATVAATGLSTGTCTNALRVLTDMRLLEADAQRGRRSGRRIVDNDALLAAYAEAAAAFEGPEQVAVGVTWRDPITGLQQLAPRLMSQDLRWAATGAVAAMLLAPLLTNFGTFMIYVDAQTVSALESVARSVGLKPIDGGRLILRSMPIGWTEGSRRLIQNVYVAPWPRVYVDLKNLGVRGEEAAEHLVEVCRDR